MAEDASARVIRGGLSGKKAASQPPQVIVRTETTSLSEQDENEGLTDEDISKPPQVVVPAETKAPSEKDENEGLTDEEISQPPQVVVPAETKTPSEKDENEGLTDEEIRLKEREDIEKLLSLIGLQKLIEMRPEIIDVMKDDLNKDLLAATQQQREQQDLEISKPQRALQLMREAKTQEELFSVGDSSTSSGTPEISTDEVIQRIHSHHERPPSGSPGENHPSQEKLRAALHNYNVDGALISGLIPPDGVPFLRSSTSTPTINLAATNGIPCTPTGLNIADSVKPLPLVSREPLTDESLLALHKVIDAHVLTVASGEVKLAAMDALKTYNQIISSGAQPVSNLLVSGLLYSMDQLDSFDDSEKYPTPLFPQSRAQQSFSVTSTTSAPATVDYKRLHEEFLKNMDRTNAVLTDKLAAEVTSQLVKTWGKESDWETTNHDSSTDGSDDEEADEEEDSDQGGASVESE